MREVLQKVMSIGHLQRGHSVKTALTRYGVSDLNLEHIDSFLLACCFNYSQEWHDYFVYGTMIPVLDEVGLITTSPKTASTTTSPKTSLLISNPAVGIESSIDISQKGGIERQSTVSEHRFQEHRIHKVATVLKLLQVLYPREDDSPRFRSVEQRDMLVLALQSLEVVQDYLFVVRTGGGKTACLGICTLMERQQKTKRVTVAIVPLISLCEDLARRLQQSGIKVNICTTSATMTYTTVTSYEVLILLPEVVGSSLGFQLLQRLHAENLLGAIFFDEFHLWFSWNSFRPVMMNVLEKCSVFEKSPRLMVTGTLPPTMQ